MDNLLVAANSFSAEWGSAVWRASWQGAIVLGVVWTVARLWPRLPPTLHSWLWRLAFLRLVLGLFSVVRVDLPVLSAALSSPTIGLAPAASSSAAPVQVMPQASFPAPVPEAVVPSLAAALLVLWLLGMSWCFLCAVRTFRRTRVLRRRAASWPGNGLPGYLATLCRDNGLSRAPELMIAEVASPLLVGIGDPCIVLPESLEQSHDVAEIRLMLAHEVAHLKRRDLWWNWLLLLAHGLFFYHPAVWLGRREWLLSQEMACDELALQMAGASEHEYRQMLLRVAAHPGAGRQAMFASSITESYHSLNRRLTAMAYRAPLTRRRLMMVGMAMFVLGTVLLVPWHPTAQADQTPHADLAPATAPLGHVPNAWDGLRELTGTIVTPEGAPIPSAGITLVGYDDDREESVVIASTQSDPRGRFAFQEPGRLLAQCSRPPTVVAQPPGWGVSFRSIGYPQEEIEITAIPRTQLLLTLADANGKPAPGVRATIYMLTIKGLPSGRLVIPPEMRAEFTGVTDEQGMCCFAGLPQGATASLRVEDERFAQLGDNRAITLGRRGATKGDSLVVARSVTLVPGATISGKIVYGSTGKPAAGVRVGAQEILGGNGSQGVTDRDGQYRLKQLPPGSYNIALDLRGKLNRSWTAVAHEDVSVSRGDRVEGMDFALIPGAVITGRVTAAETGAPISSVLVGVYGPAHPRSTGWVQNTETAADGSYCLRVPAGKQYLYLQGKWPAGFSSPEQSSHDIELKDGDKRTVDFALPGSPLKPIHGRVFGPDGKPVPGAEVIVLPGWRIIKAGAKGEFALEPAEVKLRARHGNLATESAGKPSTEGEVVLRMRRGVLASVTGLVTDATEKPVAGAHVGLFVSVLGQWLPVGNEVTTDAEGRYRFPSLWPHQAYQVAVRQKLEGREPGSDTTFELGTGETRELPTLRATAAGSRD